MSWARPSAALARSFDAALPNNSIVERRRMFGCAAAFVNGNMFAGLHREDVLVRLSAAERQELFALGGTVWEPTQGRVMRNYALLPKALDQSALFCWLQKAFDHTAQLPPKSGRNAKTKASG